MKNNDIRMAAYRAGVRLWQVADALNIADSSLSRKLRHDVSAEEREHILSIIAQLEEERDAD